MKDSDAILFLERLIRVPSVSCAEGQAAAFLVEQMDSFGFQTEIDDAGNPVGKIETSGPRIVLLGHIDTVPGVVSVRREDGKLYGRGAVDAKGPLAAFIAAAVRAADSGNLQAQVEVIGCVEEEVPSSKGARFRVLGAAPDLCINGEPSGWQGVTLGYKGYLRARLQRSLPIEHSAGKASGMGALACRAYVAIEQAAALYNQGREALFDQVFTHLSQIELNSDGLFEHASLDVRLRLPGELGPQVARTWLCDAVPGWEVDCSNGLEAWSSPRTDPVARLLGRAISREGGRPRFIRKTGTSDMNVVGPVWKCPIVAYGPGDSALDHTPDEHIRIDEFLASIRILEGFLTDPNLSSWSAPLHSATRLKRPETR